MLHESVDCAGGNVGLLLVAKVFGVIEAHVGVSDGCFGWCCENLLKHYLIQ